MRRRERFGWIVRVVGAVIALGIGAGAGCEANVPEGRFVCDADEDCPAAMTCRTTVRRCYGPDAGD